MEATGKIKIRSCHHDNDEICIEIGDTGKGIGLGPSLSYGFVKRHGDHIEVESNPGQGATFRLLLPINPRQVTKTHDSEISL